MNERILELARQIWPDTNVSHINHEKFAELILAETISVLQKRFMGDLNREDMEVRRCIEDVKKHFGVQDETK